MGWLKPNQLKILRRLAEHEDEEGGELVRAIPGGWWIESDRQRGQDCMALLRFCLIRQEDVSNDGTYFVHTINEEGRALAENPEREPEIIRHMRARMT